MKHLLSTIANQKSRVFIKRSVFVLMTLCLSSCKKPPGYSAISDQRLRDAVNIHPGSYFIYQDSITKIEDSFWAGRYVHQDWFDRDANENFEQIQYTIGDSAIGFTLWVGAPYGTIMSAAMANMARYITTSYLLNCLFQQKAWKKVVLVK